MAGEGEGIIGVGYHPCEFVHHEFWDGRGYPDGLAGEEIPLGARVICATEVFDALTTPRPYQKRLAPDDAVKRMRQITGKVIAPAVMDALASAVEARKALIFIDDGHSPT